MLDRMNEFIKMQHQGDLEARFQVKILASIVSLSSYF